VVVLTGSQYRGYHEDNQEVFYILGRQYDDTSDEVSSGGWFATGEATKMWPSVDIVGLIRS